MPINGLAAKPATFGVNGINALGVDYKTSALRIELLREAVGWDF